MDWESAEKWLYEVKETYESIGFSGAFALGLFINPVVKRFENGERSQALYDEIMSLE